MSLRRLLLARYRAAVPRVDRLIVRGSAVRAAGGGTEDGSRRILRDQLGADLADLSAARGRVKPAIARLSAQDGPEVLQQETGLIVSDLHRLEGTHQPVRDDLQALSSLSTASTTFPRALFRPAQVSARPAAFVAATPAPITPKPTVSPQTVTPPSKPPAPPKPPASSGQEFIMWGK